MNEPLIGAVNRALDQLGGDRVGDWRQVVMVKNADSIPYSSCRQDGASGRGFNLLLLSGSGRSKYYVRCRVAGDPTSAREAQVLGLLTANPDIRPHLPEVGVAVQDGIRILAARYVDGTLFARLLPRMSRKQWRDSVVEVLRLARKVGSVGLDVLPPAVEGRYLDLPGMAAPSLAVLAAAGVRPVRLEALSAMLSKGAAVRGYPQHGDLWPGNVMRHGNNWKLLDFEHFGLVTCPLYDACHLMHTSVDYLLAAGRGLPFPLTHLMRRDARLAEGIRDVLAREAGAYQLDGPQARACLVFHLMDMSARLIRNRVGAAVVGPMLREVDAVAASCADPMDLYFGGALRGAA